MSMHSPIYGLLLSGGESRRMGEPKELLQWHGETELSRLSSLLTQVCDQTFLSQREPSQASPSPLSLPVITDTSIGSGPLAGIYAAHQQHPDAHWLILSCDLPLIDLDHLKQLRTAFQTTKGAAYSTAFESRFDKKSEPLCAIYNKDDLKGIPSFFEDESNHHCARCFFKSLENNTLITPQLPDAIDNCNTPGDRHDIELRLKNGRGPLEIKLEHFAQLFAITQVTEQPWTTYSRTTHGVWEELRMRYKIKSLSSKILRPVVNDELVSWSHEIHANDTVSFLPPFAGG